MILHILLTILHVLGRILLALLILILLLLLIVLLCPVRYEATGSKDSEGLSGEAKATWLWRAIGIAVTLKGKEPSITFRLFGVTPEGYRNFFSSVKGRFRKHDRKEEKETASSETDLQKEAEKEEQQGFTGEKTLVPDEPEETGSAGEAVVVPVERMETIPDRESAEETPKSRKRFFRKKNAGESPGSDSAAASGRAEDEDAGQGTGTISPGILIEKALSLLELVTEIPWRFVEVLEKAAEALKKPGEALEKLKKKLSPWLRLLKTKEFAETKDRILKELFHLLKLYLPRRMEGKVRFGMEDPADTGMILGVCACFYPQYSDKLKITPDFEEKILEGQLTLKGHIRLIHVAATALRLVITRSFWRTVKRVIRILKHKEA